jgi:hypothetical protein
VLAAGGVAAAVASEGADAEAAPEVCEVTVAGCATSSLPPAVKRSVSVTDFLSFPR